MKRKILIKPLFFSSIVVFTAILLASCVLKPVDTDFEDNEKVIIIDNTGDGLIAENGRITGLDPNKYYMVEELDENGNTVHVGFVGSDGIIGNFLGDIGLVKGGAILNLNNDHTYLVSAAANFASNGIQLSYFDMESGYVVPSPTPTKTVVVNSGAINLAAPNVQYYLNLAPYVSPVNTYEVMTISIKPGGLPWGNVERVSGYFNLPAGNLISTINPVNFERRTGVDGINAVAIYQFAVAPDPAWLYNMSIMPLREQNTISDYVFVERNSSGDITDFKVLKVTIDPAIEYGDLTVSVTVTYTPNLTDPQIVSNTSTLNTDGIVIFSITNGAEFSSFTWYLNGVALTGGSGVTLGINGALTYDFSLIPMSNIIGDHVFVVEGSRGGVRQSSEAIISFALP